MTNLEVHIIAVVKQLKSFNKNKSYGPDYIPIGFLSDYGEAIAPYLTGIYNRSLKAGSVPKDRKVAQVTTIFKKGSRSNTLNYRPISLT